MKKGAILKQTPSFTQEIFLNFMVGKHQFSLPISVIRRVIRTVRIIQVPDGPENMLGIINQRHH